MLEETNNPQITEETTPSAEAVVDEKELAGNVYNTDNTDVDLETFSEAVRSAKKQSLRGPLMTIVLLLSGILAVLLFWIIRYKDLFL